VSFRRSVIANAAAVAIRRPAIVAVVRSRCKDSDSTVRL
jgi:hypothetical protein